MLSGCELNAAGIVPYTETPGGGMRFLLQDILNGTRAGKLSDFGGRREATDEDIFATAAREFTEETGGVFGDERSLAHRLRSGSTVRIMNRSGRYVTFFLKVPYVDESQFREVRSATS